MIDSNLDPRDIKIEDYTYSLPDDKIAKYPLQKRDNAKLLCYNGEEISTHLFSGIAFLLPENSVMVMNTTKVIHARLEFFRVTGARIEVFCLEPHTPALYEQSLASKREVVWHCLVGQAKKWKEQYLERILPGGGILRVSRVDDSDLIRFEWDCDLTFGNLLEQLGELPIPPYLNRKTEESDLTDYQTVYAEQEGSVAAPTAGLHFTDELLQKIREQGIQTIPVTLHVGAGTFLPVKSNTMGGHQMHTEVIEVALSSIESLRDCVKEGKPIVSVGTTSTRTLESLYYMGAQLIQGEKKAPFHVAQWFPYLLNDEPTLVESLDAIITRLKAEREEKLLGQTQLMIAPGYRYKVVDYLVTNFHQPHSTLLLLVAAFIGEDWRKVYDYALENNYRFLSYGDGSLLKKK